MVGIGMWSCNFIIMIIILLCCILLMVGNEWGSDEKYERENDVKGSSIIIDHDQDRDSVKVM